MISGKRNDVVDSGIVEVDRSGALGRDERELNALAGVRDALFAEDLLDAAKDQAFGGAALVGGTRFEALVERSRDVNCGAHENRLPYLWLERECGHVKVLKPASMGDRTAAFQIAGKN